MRSRLCDTVSALKRTVISRKRQTHCADSGKMAIKSHWRSRQNLTIAPTFASIVSAFVPSFPISVVFMGVISNVLLEVHTILRVSTISQRHTEDGPLRQMKATYCLLCCIERGSSVNTGDCAVFSASCAGSAGSADLSAEELLFRSDNSTLSSPSFSASLSA